MENDPDLAETHRDTILLVDDEQELLDSLEDFFRVALHDVEIEKSTDAQKALERLHAGGVDLIMSDLKLPGTDGLQFLQEARRVAPDVPRILMTAHADLHVAVQAIDDARITCRFTKPLDLHTVVEEVWRALDSHRARMQKDAVARVSLDPRRARGSPLRPRDGMP